MTVTFTPATNRYAAIAATVAAGPSEAERAAMREAMLRRRHHPTRDRRELEERGYVL